MTKNLSTKPWYRSKTLWGIACLILPKLIRLVDTYSGSEIMNPELESIFTLAGGYLGVSGRLRADTNLGKK